MTSDSIDKLLARFENGERLTQDEKDRICRHSSEPEFRNRLVDRLAVADLLSFEEVSKDASSFVAATVQRYSEEYSGDRLPFVISEEPGSPSVGRNAWTFPQVLTFTLTVLVSGFLLGAWAWSSWLPAPTQNDGIATSPRHDVEDSKLSSSLDGGAPPSAKAIAAHADESDVHAEIVEPNLPNEREFESLDPERVPESPMKVVQSDGPKIPVPNAMKSMDEETVKPILAPKNEPQAPPIYFATVLDSDQSKWADSRENESQLTAGSYELIEGKTNLAFSNGVQVAILAPSRFEILAENRIKFDSGIYSIEMPRKRVDLSIETPQANLFDGNYARVQMIVGDQKSETLLTRGSINLLPQNDLPGKELKLQKNNLVQTVIQQSSTMPRLLAATGPKKFEARIGEGAKQARFSSPIVFGNVLQNLATVDQKNPKLVRQPRSWQTLVDSIQSMPSNPTQEQIEERFRKLFEDSFQNPQKNRDGNSNRSSSFQGSFSTNGVTREFNSLADFEKFHREWMNPGQKQQGQGQQPTPHRTPLQFSSPETFRQLRKQMRF